MAAYPTTEDAYYLEADRLRVPRDVAKKFLKDTIRGMSTFKGGNAYSVSWSKLLAEATKHLRKRADE